MKWRKNLKKSIISLIICILLCAILFSQTTRTQIALRFLKGYITEKQVESKDKTSAYVLMTTGGLTIAAGTGLWTVSEGTGYFNNQSIATTDAYGLLADTNVLRWSIDYNNCIS